jgi:hypothetical protein
MRAHGTFRYKEMHPIEPAPGGFSGQAVELEGLEFGWQAPGGSVQDR